MTTTARNIGTLIVVILKARNLPNKRQFGKQDPYCSVSLNGETRKTKIIKRGGQHPEWDEEVRFNIYEDPDALSSSGGGTPPPLPPKGGRGPKKILGGERMAVACFAADKDPDLIGEATVDLTEVLTKGETDEWFTLTNKDKYSGEVYLELTFWSNEPRPEKKSTPRLVKANKQYGGPGTFVPSEDSPNHLQQGSGSFHEEYRRESLPSAFLPSNSSTGLDLYKPEYEHTVKARAPRSSSVDQVVNDMGELRISGSGRRDTFPPAQSNFSLRSVSTSAYSVASSGSSQAFPASDGSALDVPASHSAVRAVTPVGQRPHRYSLSSAQPHDYPQYQPAYEPGSLPPSRSLYHTPPRHGPRYSMPTASSGFMPVPSASESALYTTRTPVPYSSDSSGLIASSTNSSLIVPGYAPAPSRSPVPTSYSSGPSVSPAPTFAAQSTPSGSFLPSGAQQPQTPYPHAGYNPSVSVSPVSHISTPPLSVSPAPPQAVVHPQLAPVSGHIPGSRPLPPQPQQVTSQRIPPPPPIPANQAYGHAVVPYGLNPVPPLATETGLPPIYQNPQNPLPIPPGPPGPLGPGSRTPTNPASAVPLSSSPYHHVPPPPTLPSQPSPSRQSPNGYIPDGLVQPSNSLPPSPVPPQSVHPRSVSGRPSLPLPPPPPLSMAPYQQQQHLPQLPIPPSLMPGSQSQPQQQYLVSSASSAFHQGQPFYPGPPPRPPAQLTE